MAQRPETPYVAAEAPYVVEWYVSLTHAYIGADRNQGRAAGPRAFGQDFPERLA